MTIDWIEQAAERRYADVTHYEQMLAEREEVRKRVREAWERWEALVREDSRLSTVLRSHEEEFLRRYLTASGGETHGSSST